MIKHALFLCVAAAAAQETVVSRAINSAAQRAERGDSLCHGTHAAAPSKETYMSFVRRSAEQQERDPDHMLRTLRDYCASDADCCKLYYLSECTDDTANELEMLRYLTPWLDKDYPLTQLLDDSGACGSQPANQYENTKQAAFANEDVVQVMLRRAWVNEMKLQAYERGQVHCAQNQKFIFSPQEAEGRCVCATNEDDCHAAYRKQSLSPWTYSTAALIVSSLAVVVLFGLEIYKVCTEIPLFKALYAHLVEHKSASRKKDAPKVTQDTFADDFLKLEHGKKN